VQHRISGLPVVDDNETGIFISKGGIGVVYLVCVGGIRQGKRKYRRLLVVDSTGKLVCIYIYNSGNLGRGSNEANPAHLSRYT